MLFLEKTLWGIAIICLFVSGTYFTFKLKFIQFHFIKMFKALKEKNNNPGISPIKSLTMTLGARIGVGSLAGIALAIYYGGVGAIFWIWVSSIICSSNAFVESVLGVIYREKRDNTYIGGPSYYIAKGMKNKRLGQIYAIMLIFTYILGFLTVQTNTVVKSITEIYNINPYIISFVIAFLTLLVIFKGINTIADFSSKLVPIMSIGYILICIYILILNGTKIPFLINNIISQAFNPISMSIGFLTPLMIGFQRGIFSNEAGLGTGAIASAASDTNIPTKQGLVQVFGIHIETLVMSTLTALVIMTANYNSNNLINVNGIEITQRAFVYHLGNVGNYIIMICIILFAFSTIISGYYYGESNLKFLCKKISSPGIIVFKFLVIIILIIGGIISSSIIWFIADILIAILGIINIYSLLSLKRCVIDECKKHY